MERNSDHESFEKFRKQNRVNRAHRVEDGPAPAIPDLRKRRTDFRKSPPRGDFRCKKCKALVGQASSGTTQRNHCPLCLHSVHLDVRPGDRSADCGSLMEPITIWVRREEWVLLHRCLGCGAIHSNRIAPDDNELALMSLAARPLGRPAFPLYRTEENESL